MKVKMLTRMAGPDWQAAPGDEIELPEAVAKVLVEGGFAEAVTPPPAPPHKSGEGSEVETTMMPAGEMEAELGPRKPPRKKPTRK